MAEPQPLRHAPITEALVDIRATPTRPIVSHREAFRDALRDHYPRFKDRHAFQAQFRFAQGKSPVATASEGGLEGFQFFSSDERSIAQLRSNGFTFNRLSPYTDGDHLIDEALRLWEIYRRTARPAGVSRVALRFINNLTLPTDPGRLGEFLDSPPTPPPGAGTLLQGFLNRVQSHDPQTGLTVIRTIASALAKPGAEGLGVLIDIDAFRSADLSVEEAELRPVLAALRTLKNDVFFGSIRDRTVEILN
jgi:uncharacterized protein (TIGR04255 family)